ncbi:Mlo-related protein [Phytophthora cinnamomi]|uniref:Mlo-related protein n=1 Tax=Phytophthora cinnamomi TaxID=4785 RepID=UPI00355A35A9|nr:Mlo-related protein [Phytophthora cinnamomi]
MGGGSLFQVGVAVEFWRVLVHLSILAFCLVLFEALLHYVEHKLSRYDKYQHMLRKAYRELMILGLLSLGLKLLKEVPGIHADSKTMLAFQVADLAIFILALALILQAIIVFSQLRRHNKVADRTELITAQDLVDSITPPAGTPPTSGPVRGGGSSGWLCCSRKPTGAAFDKEVVERRLLRHLFLRRFGLPQLFPFSKYLRRAQASQISHMIEVEPSMWVLLLAVAWAICGVVAVLDSWEVDLPESHELVEVLMIFGWVLLVLHLVVLLYFRWCLRQLLDAAGYSDNEAALLDNLRVIAEEEALAWQNEAADTALDTMNRVQDELEEIEDRRNAERHVLLRKDVGLQLVATCCRNMNKIGVAKLRTGGRVPSGVQSGTPHIRIRFFSRKAWHVTVMFLLILNGFFIALLVQCAVYDLDDIYKEFGLLPAILVPLPLVLNTFVFQQRMFRYFVIVCSVLRVESNTLGEVVNHFSEIVEMRTEFGSSLLECLKEGDYTIVDLRRELHAYDPKQTGLIDVDRLRIVLAAFGFRLTRFRFNSVAMMLFEMNGTRVEKSKMGGGSLFQVGNAVEFWRVLVHLSVLAFCLVIFEAALHHVEHKLARYDKYQHMLRKGYRELMILGLLSLGLKVIKEIPGIQADSKTMLAFQVADLAIFILALALILQAITIFSQLRKHNNMGDRTELISAQDLVDSMNPSPAASSATGLRHSSWHLWPEETPSFEKEVVEQRLLRHLFLRRFGLPQLFPFSKYLRRAQANQISHMIEVEPSMWVLLLAVAWAICAFVTILEKFVDLPESRDLVEVFVAFAWILVGLHVAVLFYFQTCMRQILVAAGYSEDNEKLVENLQTIADEEAIAWRNEAADSALDTMNRVQEELEEFEDHLDSRRHVLLQHDTGFQLVATCYRKIKRVGATTKPRETIGVQPETPDINIRYFSRKAWHVVVIFLLMLNGFFIALLIQCAVYNLDEVYGDFGLVPAIMVPLPVLLNTFVFQERMFRYFVTVCSIIRVDASTLGEVVHHFSEIVELRSEFAATLLERLRDGDYSVLDLRAELDAYDTHKTGMIDVDKLRYILAAFGYRLTRFRFNSVAMLLFELRGTKISDSLVHFSTFKMAGASLFQVGGNVEFWRVLVHLSILAVFLLGFEAALHHLEHRLARYDKYHAMLQKVYRELMVLGLISLILKVLKEVTPVDSYNKPMIAFQVADLIIFGLAIALILQSICIFLLLRGHSSRADEAEFIMTEDLRSQ